MKSHKLGLAIIAFIHSGFSTSAFGQISGNGIYPCPQLEKWPKFEGCNFYETPIEEKIPILIRHGSDTQTVCRQVCINSDGTRLVAKYWFQIHGIRNTQFFEKTTDFRNLRGCPEFLYSYTFGRNKYELRGCANSSGVSKVDIEASVFEAGRGSDGEYEGRVVNIHIQKP